MTPGPAAAAFVCHHLERQLGIVLANEPGCRTPDDIVHVHDFRVAQRRTRVLVRQYRDLLPPGARTLADELRWVGKRSGPVRDLDVLDRRLRLLAERSTGVRRDGFEALRAALHVEREQARARFVRRLDSDRYRALLDRWKTVAGARSLSHGSARAFRIESAPRILLLHGRLCEAAAVFDVELTPDETIHELRIEAKKLRYLLEFAAEGPEGQPAPADPSAIARATRRLKALQDRLGAFQDLAVHEELLRGWTARHPELEAVSRTAHALADGLGRRRIRARRPIAAELARFTGTWMTRQMRAIVLSLER